MNKKVPFWFLAGIGFGAVVGLLYAPRSGVRTRAIAVAKAKKSQRLLERRGEQLQRRMEQGVSVARRAGERISRALEARRKT
jgi:gas vesicle protein